MRIEPKYLDGSSFRGLARKSRISVARPARVGRLKIARSIIFNGSRNGSPHRCADNVPETSCGTTAAASMRRSASRRPS